jgi:hypothetical protein
MEDIKALKDKIDYYENKLGVGKFNPSLAAFEIYVEQLRQQTKYLKDFKLIEKIGNPAKDDPVYARSMDLIEGLPKMITEVFKLQIELKVEYSIEDENVRVKPIRAENM